jgi:cytochrome P450
VTELGLLRDGRNPFPEYARMLERGRVHRPRASGGWVVCGHAEVESVLRDPRTFSSEIGGGQMGVGNSMIMKDPPEHTRLRNIVSKAFTPRSIAELEPRIREITVRLLDEIEPREPFDIVDRLAIPLPITVIAEMLGVDPADRVDFKRWSNAIIGTVPIGVQVPMKITMKNLLLDSFTTFEVLRFDPSPHLPDSAFDLRRLETH